MKRTLTAVVALVAVCLAAACSPAVPSGPTLDQPGPHEMREDRAQLGDRWPLTVDSVFLSCPLDKHYVVRPVGSMTVYALNGTAKGDHEYADINGIWADDTELGNGLKKDISPLIQEAAIVCIAKKPG